jgi:hypothetical protein
MKLENMPCVLHVIHKSFCTTCIHEAASIIIRRMHYYYVQVVLILLLHFFRSAAAEQHPEVLMVVLTINIDGDTAILLSMIVVMARKGILYVQ